MDKVSFRCEVHVRGGFGSKRGTYTTVHDAELAEIECDFAGGLEQPIRDVLALARAKVQGGEVVYAERVEILRRLERKV